MKFPAVLSLFMVLCFNGLHAQKPAAAVEVETKWPGVHYQVVDVRRTPDNRVTLTIKIMATARAPKAGTLIGVAVPIPPGASQDDIDRGMYAPQPFSLETSVITDDKTGRQYPAVKPVPGGNTLAGEILCTLRPLQGETLAVQFELPPPSPDAEGHAVRQTASLLLTNAEKPILKIEIPPLVAAAPAH